MLFSLQRVRSDVVSRITSAPVSLIVGAVEYFSYFDEVQLKAEIDTVIVRL